MTSLSWTQVGENKRRHNSSNFAIVSKLPGGKRFKGLASFFTYEKGLSATFTF